MEETDEILTYLQGIGDRGIGPWEESKVWVLCVFFQEKLAVWWGQVKPSQVTVAISRARLLGKGIFFLSQIVDYSSRPN